MLSFADYFFLRDEVPTPPLLLSYSSPLLLYHSPSHSKLASSQDSYHIYTNSSHLSIRIESEEYLCLRGEIHHGQPPIPGFQLAKYTQHFLMRKFAYIQLGECGEDCEFFLVLKLVSPSICKLKPSDEIDYKRSRTNITVLVDYDKKFESYVWVKICLFPCLFFLMYLVFLIIYIFEKYIHMKNSKFGFIFLTPEAIEEQSGLLSRWGKEEFAVKKREYEEIISDFSWNLETKQNLTETSKFYLEKKYMRFVWGICSICLFFGLPALQSTFLKQEIASVKGDLDFCYFNSRCATHIWNLHAFNNVWSNSGFVLLGVLFIIIVITRYRNSRQAETGVDRYLGLELAMGLSMITEGLMSALYHACPNAGNYKYDTLFMFVSLLLIMLQLYTSRHAHSNLSSHTFILLIGVFICLSILEALESSQLLYCIRSIYILFVIITTLTLFVNIYHLGNASLLIFTIHDVITKRKSIFRVFWPRHNKHRMVHIFFVLGINLCGSSCLLFIPKLEMGTVFIGMFGGNFCFYLCYYWVMKLVKREHKHNTPVFLVTFSIGILSAVLWIIALIVFRDRVTNWAMGPVLSKEMNRECVLWGFYDSHDLWHILSAYAMFFTFLSIVKTDDNVASVRRDKLSVF